MNHGFLVLHAPSHYRLFEPCNHQELLWLSWLQPKMEKSEGHRLLVEGPSPSGLGPQRMESDIRCLYYIAIVVYASVTLFKLLLVLSKFRPV